MKRIPRRIITEEFKKVAVHLFKEQNLTLAEVSRNLDVAPKSSNLGWHRTMQARLKGVWVSLSSHQIKCALES